MKYIRIRSYNEGHLAAEHAYIGDNQVKSIERFRNEYPEHANCIVVAETIDDQDPNWKEWFRVARNCGCVHCFN